jgi:hypothetical protein
VDAGVALGLASFTGVLREIAALNLDFRRPRREP